MSTGPTKPLAEVAALALQLAPIEKGRIQADTLTRLVAVLDAPGSVFTETPFYRRIAATLATGGSCARAGHAGLHHRGHGSVPRRSRDQS